MDSHVTPTGSCSPSSELNFGPFSDFDDSSSDDWQLCHAPEMALPRHEALNRTFQELKQAKNQDLRSRAAHELYGQISAAYKGKANHSTTITADFQKSYLPKYSSNITQV